MEQRGREHNSWEELVEKTINAEAKTSVQLQSILCKMDLHCPCGNRPTNSTLAKSSAPSTRDSHDNPVKKTQTLALKRPNSSRPENGRTFDK